MKKYVTLGADEYENMLELLEAAFHQSCGQVEHKGPVSTIVYDHSCLSTWEDIQDFLIKKGRITKSQCRRD